MNDSASRSDDPSPVNFSLETQPDFHLVELEGRLQRLEDEVIALKNTRALEDKIVERVSERLRQADFSESISASPRAGPHLDINRPRIFRGHYIRLVIGLLTEFRLMFLMFFDKRFPLAWTTHVAVWLFIPAILTSSWWFPGAYIPFLGPYLDKVLDLLLAFCVYKALIRDVRRYREVFR